MLAHMRNLALILWIVTGAFSGLAQQLNLPSPDVYGSKIEIRTDIKFGDSEQQKLDLYRPSGTESAPVVICWFGGAFWGADKSHMASICAFLASHGFAAVAPNYFLGEKDGTKAAWPNAIYDAKAAVRFVRSNAKELRIDPGRMVALGFSSGAYLAAMVGFTPNLAEMEDTDVALSEPCKVSAVVAIAGVYDRRGALGLPLALLGKGYESKYDLRVATSPIIYIGPNTVPVYILHGDHDSVVNVASAKQLAAALEEAHVPRQVRIVDADHSPINEREFEAVIVWLRKML